MDTVEKNDIGQIQAVAHIVKQVLASLVTGFDLEWVEVKPEQRKSGTTSEYTATRFGMTYTVWQYDHGTFGFHSFALGREYPCASMDHGQAVCDAEFRALMMKELAKALQHGLHNKTGV